MVQKNIYGKYFSLFCVGVCVMGCSISSGYSIQGTVDPSFNKQVFLLSDEREVGDTLAKAVVVNGKFNLNGSIEGVQKALLQLEDGDSSLPFFLENSSYQATLQMEHPEENVIRGGGASQKAANAWTSIDRHLSQQIDAIREEYVEAARHPENGHFERLNLYLDSLQKNAEQQRELLLNQYADSYFALSHLASIASRLPLEELKLRFEKVGPSLQNGHLGKVVMQQIRRMEALSVGSVAPDFTLLSPDGSSFTLHGVKAKVKLLDFWASWCAPCRALVPQLRQLYDEYHNCGFEVVGISVDENESAWKKAIKEEKMKWLQGSDLKGFKPDNELNQLYNISHGIPYFVLLDGQNRIRAIGTDFKLIRTALIEVMNE
ncbi:alkyl hydroperoxide reductase/ Thiol specific antioxidant/ Mal allergen [gut metagenome]|uniref:Alkyl hydroperoxide reductase/ Thiol specific antioxidant/ Mal allergen n=1 Tax=gut metagenome TaxID=749906 RepID=J9FR11_9ZZZZ